MKFILKSAKVRHRKNDINPSVYEKYGFTVNTDYQFDEYIFLGNPEIEVNNITELMSIIKDFGVELIVSDGEITIYNGYIE